MSRRLTSSLCWAAAALLAACQPSAEDVAAQAAQAQQLLDAGQVQQAEELINAAVRERDDVPLALLVQAHVALARGNRGLAYQAYSNALALDAANPEALMAVAQLGVGTGHVAEAESAADKVLVLQPEQTDALTVKALIAVARSDVDAAGELADRILRAQPGDLAGLILKSRVQALRGDREAALATLRSQADRYADSPDYAMALAELYRARGDGAGLLEQLGRIRTLAPANLGYRLDLADLLYRTGDRYTARAEIAALIEIPVTDAAVIERIVRLWHANDREAMAPDQVEAASRKASLEARLAFARYFVADGRPAAAVTLLKPLASGWSSEIQGHYAYAGDVAGADGARAEAERLLAADPSNGGALLVRIRRAMADGRARAAVVDAQRVIADYPQWDEGYLSLAAAYAALDNDVGVRRAFESGIKARPQSLPLATAYVGRLPALGDPGRAIEVARRFALDSPSLPAAWSLYTKTCAALKGDDCRGEAAAGLARSRTIYGLDPAPGTPPTIAAIGRLV